MTQEKPIKIQSGSLGLEAMLREGDGSLSAVVLHPHPQYGGDMDNHVVVAIAGALSDTGATTLRFNFRGTGDSEGSYDGGRGEADDARAALASMRERTISAPLLLVGYSFGAMIAAAVAGDTVLAGLVLVSPPLGMTQLPPLQAGLPVLIATGDCDPISPPAAVQALAATGVETLVVPGADHGWWPGVETLASATAAFAEKLGGPVQ